MTVHVRLSGLDRLALRLSKIGRGPDVGDAVVATADDIADRARRNLNDGAPPETRTGKLEASIEVMPGDRLLERRVGTALDYGAHLEFGTVRGRPRPWLGPAFEQARSDLMARLARALRP